MHRKAHVHLQEASLEQFLIRLRSASPWRWEERRSRRASFAETLIDWNMRGDGARERMRRGAGLARHGCAGYGLAALCTSTRTSLRRAVCALVRLREQTKGAAGDFEIVLFARGCVCAARVVVAHEDGPVPLRWHSQFAGGSGWRRRTRTEVWPSWSIAVEHARRPERFDERSRKKSLAQGGANYPSHGVTLNYPVIISVRPQVRQLAHAPGGSHVAQSHTLRSAAPLTALKPSSRSSAERPSYARYRPAEPMKCRGACQLPGQANPST